MPGINMPGQRPSAWDALSKALSVGASIYGIKSDMDRLEIMKQENERKSAEAQQEGITRGLQQDVLRTQLQREQKGLKDYEKTAALSRQEKEAEINYKNAMASAAGSKDSANILAKIKLQNELNNYDYNRLPDYKKEQVKDIAQKNAKLKGFALTLEQGLKSLNDPKVSEDQKVVLGQSLLKVVNSISTLSPDAVSADERDALGSFLEYKIGNLKRPGSFVGRDIGEFNLQMANLTDRTNAVIDAQNEIINQIKSGKDIQGSGGTLSREMTRSSGNQLIPSAMATDNQKMPSFNPLEKHKQGKEFK